MKRSQKKVIIYEKESLVKLLFNHEYLHDSML